MVKGNVMDQKMFQFAKLRLQEIEKVVKEEFQDAQGYDQQRNTSLKNESAEADIAQCQKELLSGKYEINLDFARPYYKRITNLSMEPVAYHLYKARHFDRKDLFKNLGSGEEKNLRGLNT